ncbi:MAG: hypothetical protein ACQESC_03300 [Nanobdellota archaeon]
MTKKGTKQDSQKNKATKIYQTTSKRKHESSKKNNNLKEKNSSRKIIPWITTIAILAVIAILATTVFDISSLFDSTENEDYGTYNHFNFEQVGDKWKTEVVHKNKLFEVPSYYHPLEVENVTYNRDVTLFLMTVPHVGFTFAVDDKGSKPVIAAVNIARILGDRYYGFDVTSSIYNSSIDQNTTTSSNVTYSNCDQATKKYPVIHISVNETEPVVRFANNNSYCVVVGGADGDQAIKAADRVVFEILQIMN